MRKARLDKIATIKDLAQVARRRIPKITLGYLESGTGGETALRRNREALDQVTLVPQYMRDVQPVRNGFINAHFSERPSNTIARAQCSLGKELLR